MSTRALAATVSPPRLCRTDVVTAVDHLRGAARDGDKPLRSRATPPPVPPGGPTPHTTLRVHAAVPRRVLRPHHTGGERVTSTTVDDKGRGWDARRDRTVCTAATPYRGRATNQKDGGRLPCMISGLL